MRCRRFTAILATVHAMRVHAMRLHALRQETARRRFILNTASLLPASLLPAALAPPPAHAADEKSAVFSGGAACYLQPFLDEIRYKA